MKAAAIVLAAGAGTRMKSKKPKVAHEILGKPLVRWAIDALHETDVEQVITVVGHGRDQIEPLVSADTDVVVQREQKGTGHAVSLCRDLLDGFDGSLLVTTGDSPLMTGQTVTRLIDMRERENAAVVMLTMVLDNPFGYGRVVRNEDGTVDRIVEQKDCTPEEAALNECNSGFYCFDAQTVFDAIDQLDNNNAQGEYYITDVPAICRREGKRVLALTCDDTSECLGVNSREQLAESAKCLQRRINKAHMDAGVTMTDPDQVWIGSDVTIEPDVELLPQTFLMGTTHVGEDSVIGPNSRLTDTTVGCRCTIEETVAVQTLIDNDVSCGPRAYLRPGTHLCDGAKAGTHVEIKKSTIGKGSKVPHLSYIGDTTMGEDVNIGAGSVTCNYDGKKKWPTTIGDGAFVGSDTMMVAPVKLGAGCIVGAGSTITKNVPDDALGLSRPEQKVIKGWAAKKRGKQDNE